MVRKLFPRLFALTLSVGLPLAASAVWSAPPEAPDDGQACRGSQPSAAAVGAIAPIVGGDGDAGPDMDPNG